MHSVRRAALRAASSTLAPAATRQKTSSFALQFAKAAARPTIYVPARHFSVTSRVAQDEDEKTITQNAINSTQEAEQTATDSPAPEAAAELQGHGVFVSNMTFDATEEHLREAFGKYGEISEVRIGRDGRGLSRGFSFVTFAEKSSADRAVAECDQSFWHGRRISVQHQKANKPVSSPRRQASAATDALYIGNIPYETTDADLNRLFRELDNVTDVRVAVDRNTGWPRGFAHADFVDVESARKAYEKLSQTSLAGRLLRVDFSQKRQHMGRREKPVSPAGPFGHSENNSGHGRQ